MGLRARIVHDYMNINLQLVESMVLEQREQFVLDFYSWTIKSNKTASNPYAAIVRSYFIDSKTMQQRRCGAARAELAHAPAHTFSSGVRT